MTKPADGTAHRHAKSAFAVQTVCQPAEEHPATQADQADGAGNRRGAQKCSRPELTRKGTRWTFTMVMVMVIQQCARHSIQKALGAITLAKVCRTGRLHRGYGRADAARG